MSRETFTIVQKTLDLGDESIIPVAKYSQALSENICDICAKHNINLLKPKVEDLNIVCDILVSVINEGTFAGAALLQHRSIMH